MAASQLPLHADVAATATVTPAAWVALWAACVALYAATASVGAQWQDSGHHILRIVTGDLIHPLGLALSHPLHFWAGQLAIWPDLAEPSLAITLVSGTAAAVTIANVYGCVVTWTGRPAAALFAALSLALAATFWQMATLVESYTLTTALIAGECWCLAGFARRGDRRWLYGMAASNGLGVANHLLATLTTPVLVWMVVTSLRRSKASMRDVWMIGLVWLAGTLPYTGLVLAAMVQTGDPLGVIRSALFGARFADSVFNARVSLRMLLIDVGFPLHNFPNLLLPAALYGLVWRPHSEPGLAAHTALRLGVAMHVLFVFRYDVVDQHMFFLPLYVLLAVAGGLGAAAVIDRSRPTPGRRWALAAGLLLLVTPANAFAFTSIGRRYDLLESVRHNKPYRDDYVYLLTPWSRTDRSAETMSTEAVRLAGPSGLVLVEDETAAHAVRYKVLRAGWSQASVKIGTDGRPILEAIQQRRNVVLVPFDADRPAISCPLGRWVRQGDLYVLTIAGGGGTAVSADLSLADSHVDGPR